jgi:hypothetical protein
MARIMKRRITLPAAALLSAALVVAGSMSAQSAPVTGAIDGIVTDTLLHPLGDATVSVFGSSLQVVTGANGRFRIADIAPGAYILFARRDGFEAASAKVEVAGGETFRASFSLERSTTPTASKDAKGRLALNMAEFDERRKMGFGQSMTQDEIEKRNTDYATELMRLFEGVQVAPVTLDGKMSWTVKSGTLAQPCDPVFWIDGTPLPTPVNLDNLPSPHKLAGIEVYLGAENVPPRFAPNGDVCAVILMWTKDGK